MEVKEMGWKVPDVVDQRMEFVAEALDPFANFREICERFGISRKTGYKWLNRFQELGRAGLRDLSRRPKSVPNSTPAELICEIVRRRGEHPSWGPKKLHAFLRRTLPGQRIPARSTIARLLDRAGLVEPLGKTRGQKRTGPRALVTPAAPNDLWTVDYKGWWKTLDRRRCEPLTIRDEWSRFVIEITATPQVTYETTRRVFEQVFRDHGLPKVIRSDNGAPFACTRSPARLSKLSAWWKALGIELDRIDPGHPYQNGSHERLHKDIRRELQTTRARNLTAQQKAFDLWRHQFNTERPHEAIGMRTPAQLYSPSPMPYGGKRPEIVYPDHYLVRNVNHKGEVYLGMRYFLSESLAGWPIGIQKEPGDTMRFWFSDLCLGVTDASLSEPLRPPRVRQ
jgi:putative transposase